jgi:hypothetical protein
MLDRRSANLRLAGTHRKLRSSKQRDHPIENKVKGSRVMGQSFAREEALP